MLPSVTDPTHPSDAELLARYRNDGDAEWFAALYLRYAELVYGVALRYLRNPADAEDAVMQLFEELLVKVRRHDIGCFRTWLHAVTRNHCLTELRRKGKMPAATLPLQLCDEAATTDRLADEAARERLSDTLARCLERLPEPQRRSIRLFFFDRLSYADIAAATSWQTKSVKSYIQNGKRNLRLCLENRKP